MDQYIRIYFGNYLFIIVHACGIINRTQVHQDDFKLIVILFVLAVITAVILYCMLSKYITSFGITEAVLTLWMHLIRKSSRILTTRTDNQGQISTTSTIIRTKRRLLISLYHLIRFTGIHLVQRYSGSL